MIRHYYDQLIDALDDYRERRDEWDQVSNAPGFYDPQGNQEARAELEIALAYEQLDRVFCGMVKRAVRQAIDC
jgi:hypothetical protein